MNSTTASQTIRPVPLLSLMGRNPFAIALAILAGLAATFILPYFFPVAPVIAESYLVGFNNHVSLLAFMGSMAAFAWWTKGFGITAEGLDAETTDAGPSPILLYIAVAAYLIFLIAEWMLLRSHPAWNEANYFLDRLQHLSHGEMPYRQFEFAYGPLLLYLPLALSRLFHLSLADSYYTSWILEFIVGVVLIYFCVRLLPSATAAKNIIFLMIAGLWWLAPFNLGINYTPFRFFLAPFFCILAARRILSSSSPLRIALELLAAEIVLLLTSSEQAIAFCGAVGLYLLLSYIQSRRTFYLVLCGAFASGSAVLLTIAASLGFFRAAGLMSHGGYNFPLLPVAQHVPIFILLFVCAAAFIDTLRARRPVGVIELLILCGIFTLPAAFGRTDIGHVLLNCTATILAAWIVLARYPSAFRRMAFLFTLAVILLPLFNVFPDQARGLRAAWRDEFAPLPSPETIESANSAGVVTAASAVDDEPKRRLLAPFGYRLSNSPGPFISADSGYYFGLIIVTSPSQIEQKIDELRAAPDRNILVPGDYSCLFNLDRRDLGHTLGTIYVPPARHTSTVWLPLCQYIAEHYRRSPGDDDYNGYEIWNPVAGGRHE